MFQPNSMDLAGWLRICTSSLQVSQVEGTGWGAHGTLSGKVGATGPKTVAPLVLTKINTHLP